MLLVMRSRAVRVLAAVSVLTVLAAGSVAVHRLRAAPAGLDPAAVCRSISETLAAWEEVGFSGAFALSAEDHGCTAGQRRAEAGDVVAQHLVDVLAVGRGLLEQPEGGVEDRRQVATGEARVGPEVPLDPVPGRPVADR